MSEAIDLTGNQPVDYNKTVNADDSQLPAMPQPANLPRNTPDESTLMDQLDEASVLVDDIILKRYLDNLEEFNIIPIDEELCGIGAIRLFKITEMVYQNDEYSTYKFASVFNAVQNLNCGVFIIADSDGKKTTFYMGVRSFDNKRTTQSLKDTLQNALKGQFPGVKTEDLMDEPVEQMLNEICTQSNHVASISCIANNKDEDFKDNEKFIQGLEKLALAMQGKKYTAVIMASSVPQSQLEQIRQAYETIYTQLSPFANIQLTYGTNYAESVSDAFSKGTSTGTSHATSRSQQRGWNSSINTTQNNSTSTPDKKAVVAKAVGAAVLGVASIATAPLTGGASIVAAGTLLAANTGLNLITPKTVIEGTSTGTATGSSESITEGSTDSVTDTQTETTTKTRGLTTGESETKQLTMQNKTLIDMLERIDKHLRRLDECESMGMWECAAYFLSDSQATAEMAAGTYKALMRGDKTGLEISAINRWGRGDTDKLPMLKKYISNFVHPVFEYRSEHTYIPVTAASLVSGNELAIQMGLPRKSVCGFPVIEHADFGKEVVRYSSSPGFKDFDLGMVFSMGMSTKTEARLNKDSLTMHTFVTGSTGSGKSNTVYEILNQLRTIYRVPFLVIEPAKGEYKNVFGRFPDVTVYGTNPKIFANLLQINPFRFPSDIHILEHLDRLVEIFNVCWPMYAAMPAVLKEAMEKAYVDVGWNLTTSENPKGELFPNFNDLLEKVEAVIESSKYSADTKGDYVGALCTRIRSLTTGLNRLIFCSDDLTDEDIFDQSAIVDLSRVGASETKSLIMGLLVMKLNEYRMTSGKINSELSHITVLEEAHNILKRTSTEQSDESSNLSGKSVEMLANSIAEMRTYGEGFIIADQAPGLLDMAVIRNTNTKIILRLPEQSDRELVGRAAGLNDDQITELSKLERGVAAVYQNDWVEPVLVKINKCGLSENLYVPERYYEVIDPIEFKKELLSFLVAGRLADSMEFDVFRLERNLNRLDLSTRNLEFVEDQIVEYNESGTLSIWKDKNNGKLSRLITEILGVRQSVEKAVLFAGDTTDLTRNLDKIVKGVWFDVPNNVLRVLNQCLMKDLSLGQDEPETRQRIYRKWFDAQMEGDVI